MDQTKLLRKKYRSVNAMVNDMCSEKFRKLWKENVNSKIEKNQKQQIACLAHIHRHLHEIQKLMREYRRLKQDL